MKKLLVPLVLFIFASSVNAAELGKRGKKEYMGACGEADAGLIYVMTNGSNASSCDAAQAVGDTRVYCACDSDGEGGYAWTTLQLASGGGGAPDLSAYVLLAGDADGQVIQGRTGSNKARIDIGETSANQAALIGGGATHGLLYAYEGGVYGESASGGTVFDLSDDGIELSSDATVLLAGDTSTGLGNTSGWTAIGGSRVNVTSLQTPPTNANDPCTAGDTIDTATFHYYCSATDTWVRVAMATW